VAADLAEGGLGHREQVSALVARLTLEARVRASRQAEDRHRSDARSTTRLAHDAEHSAAVELEVDPVDGVHDPVLGREPDLEALHVEESLRHYVGRIRGSRNAYTKSTIALKSTMKNAPKSVTPMIGGRSKLPIDWAAYWPTP